MAGVPHRALPVVSAPHVPYSCPLAGHGEGITRFRNMASGSAGVPVTQALCHWVPHLSLGSSVWFPGLFRAKPLCSDPSSLSPAAPSCRGGLYTRPTGLAVARWCPWPETLFCPTSLILGLVSPDLLWHHNWTLPKTSAINEGLGTCSQQATCWYFKMRKEDHTGCEQGQQHG